MAAVCLICLVCLVCWMRCWDCCVLQAVAADPDGSGDIYVLDGVSGSSTTLKVRAWAGGDRLRACRRACGCIAVVRVGGPLARTKCQPPGFAATQRETSCHLMVITRQVLRGDGQLDTLAVGLRIGPKGSGRWPRLAALPGRRLIIYGVSQHDLMILQL